MKRTILLALCLLAQVSRIAPAQERDVVVTGGWLFTSTSNDRIRNPGILIRAGKFLRVGGDLSVAAPNAEHVQVADTETVIPGLFDLHAHYAIELFNAGRKDETVAYPSLFLANGVTSTFPAGEMDPNAMHDLRVRIENGVEPGPRLLNSGPYFGTARPGWNRNITTEEIYAEVDHWAELGVKGFKAKGITPDELKALIERAHLHGLTVTGHLDSGNRNSVNPRDAIMMGIDRIEHFMGGDAFTPDKSAYASYEHMTFDTPEFRKIAALYKEHHVYFDATLSAYGYYGKKDPEVFTYFVDEKKFLTPYMRSVVDARPPRPVNQQFENIYWTKRKEVKAFYDAGGGDLITLGTDHPSWGEYFTPFSVHRELLSLSLSGIPNAAVLKIATINSARAFGVGDRLGSIETGKWADLVVVRGNPLADIRRTRLPRVVIKAGRVYDPAALMKSVEGKIGPVSAADTAVWAPTPPPIRRPPGAAPTPPTVQGSQTARDQASTGTRPTPGSAARSGNPIFPGWYADPEAHVFDGQYWVYPTYSAPYNQQTFMDAFSSKDLVTWEKHPHVLDISNVAWAKRAVWAPSIIEKDGWYYIFFGANDIQNDQQLGGIGVARSRTPDGPFKDILGKPLIDKFHNGAQPIDPFVFKDRDGAYYIVYGGWKHCNIARLNDDLSAIIPLPDGTMFKEITPAGYVEGSFMLLKDDKYYFMWSEGGWTGPNYAVAYAIGSSPFGPFERVGKILQQDSTVATGAGHHSVLHSPASDKWYIVYHRRPLGETDANHRVVSIDELRFDERGFIQPVKITKEGVAADPLRP